MSLRLAIVAIAKNEVTFAERFLRSCEGADVVVVADTGSTDGTVGALIDARQNANIGGLAGGSIAVVPWRFDDARNAAVALCPRDADFCLALDLDEVLVPGWRGLVEKALARTPDATRIRYGYVWNHDESSAPLVRFTDDRFHARTGYRWIFPCHETLMKYSDGPEVFATIEETLIEHWADDSKSRASYLPLLEMAAREYPYDRRVQLYLLREQLFRQPLGVTSEAALMFGQYAVSQGFPIEGRHALEFAASLAETPEQRIRASLALAKIR